MMMINSWSHSYIPYWKDGKSVGNFATTSDFQELSGMACATRPENVASYFWTVSDSPANCLYAISNSNASSQGKWTLSGVSTASPSDWEDLASCRVNGVSYLYVADFGDNPNTRTTFNIHRAIEPVVTGSAGTISAGDIHTIVCQYPAANLPTHKDAECLIVDPDTGDLYVITKREAIPGVYFLAHAATYSGTQTLTYLGKMFDIPDITTQPLGATACNVVAGTISPNGKDILVKNYNDVYYFARPNKSVSIYTALTQTPILVNAYVGGGTTTYRKSHPTAEPQGESVCFDRDGQNFFTCSEYLTAEGSSATAHPLFKYERVSAVPTSISFQDGVLPTAGYAGTLDTYIWDTNPTTNNGTATSMIADKAAGVETDQRKALLKFDISSIPSTAKVISARLDLYINTEGQGFALYPILTQNWNESSTYNSLSGGIDNDGTEASATSDCTIYTNIDTYVGSIRCNLNLSTVQNWINGTVNNYGWLIESIDNAGDGLQFDTRQGATASRRPKLTIQYV